MTTYFVYVSFFRGTLIIIPSSIMELKDKVQTNSSYHIRVRKLWLVTPRQTQHKPWKQCSLLLNYAIDIFVQYYGAPSVFSRAMLASHSHFWITQSTSISNYEDKLHSYLIVFYHCMRALYTSDILFYWVITYIYLLVILKGI